MASVWINALVAGAVTICFNTLYYYIILRPQSRRDRQSLEAQRGQDTKLRNLESEIKDLRDDKLSALETKIDTNHKEFIAKISRAAERREKIYKRMENELMNRRDCLATQENINKRFDGMTQDIRGLRAEVSENNQTTSKMLGIVELMASHMNISIGERKPKS